MSRLIYSLLLCSSCAAFPSSQASECSETSLGLIVTDCKLKVERECPPDSDLEQCPAVQECDARVEAWERCR